MSKIATCATPGFTILSVLLPQRSIIGKIDADFMRHEEAKHLTEIKQRVLQTGKGEQLELQTTSVAGVHMHDLTVDPLYDSNGTIIGVTGISIT